MKCSPAIHVSSFPVLVICVVWSSGTFLSFLLSSVFHCLPLVACCDHICISVLELLSVTIVFVFYDVIIRVVVIISSRRSGFLTCVV